LGKNEGESPPVLLGASSMNIFFIHPIDPEHTKPGGIRSYILNLMKYLPKDVKTFLVGISIDGKPKSNFTPLLSGRVSTLQFLIALFFKKTSLNIPRNSILHLHYAPYVLPFLLPKRQKIVLTIHGLDLLATERKRGKLIAFLFSIIESFVLRRVDKIIIVNDSIANYYSNVYPPIKEKIAVIPVGIDTSIFTIMNKTELRKKYDFDSKDKIVLYVGRLRKDKRIALLIESFKHVKQKIPEAKLIVVGEGIEKPALENLVKTLELSDVLFLDTLSHRQIPEIMNCADVFSLCSLYESGPLVVQEALACGIPVITTDVGRVKEFIKNGVGRIVGGDAEEIATNIVNFLDSNNTKTRILCRNAALNFGFRKTAEQLSALYGELIDGRGK
jgi:glycosyltransferase involved in cell wall biosynthesis